MQPISTSGVGNPVSTTTGHAYVDDDQQIFAGPGQAESGLIWYSSSIDVGQSRTFGLSLESATGQSTTLSIDAATLTGGTAVLGLTFGTTLITNS